MGTVVIPSISTTHVKQVISSPTVSPALPRNCSLVFVSYGEGPPLMRRLGAAVGLWMLIGGWCQREEGDREDG